MAYTYRSICHVTICIHMYSIWRTCMDFPSILIHVTYMYTVYIRTCTFSVCWSRVVTHSLVLTVQIFTRPSLPLHNTHKTQQHNHTSSAYCTLTAKYNHVYMYMYMYIIHCTLQCTLYIVHYNVHYTLYITMYIIHCTLQCTLYIVHYNVHVSSI